MTNLGCDMRVARSMSGSPDLETGARAATNEIFFCTLSVSVTLESHPSSSTRILKVGSIVLGGRILRYGGDIVLLRNRSHEAEIDGFLEVDDFLAAFDLYVRILLDVHWLFVNIFCSALSCSAVS